MCKEVGSKPKNNKVYVQLDRVGAGRGVVSLILRLYHNTYILVLSDIFEFITLTYIINRYYTDELITNTIVRYF